MKNKLILAAGLLATAPVFANGPYPALTGISAAADDASVAGKNPAGMTRFDSRNMRGEVYAFFYDNTWEGQLGNGPSFTSVDDGTTIIPSGSLVLPFKDKYWFGFTILGSAFSEDYGDTWPGRYFLKEYDLVYISAFPSIATKINDKWSLAGSLAITYTTFEQDKAVLNEPGFGDGNLNIDTDGVTAGWAISTLYEHSERTRFGISLRSEIDAELDGNADFSNLSPATEAALDAAGLLGARVDVESTQPMSIVAGLYHEFENTSSVTFDVIWADFSEFTLSEIYVEGDQILEDNVDYDDIIAFSTAYNWAVNDRLRLGVGAMWVDDMVSDDDRSITLRLDSLWSAGIGLEWQWTDRRAITASLNYLEIGDAPINTQALGSLGALTGEYTDRGTIWLHVGMNIGDGDR